MYSVMCSWSHCIRQKGCINSHLLSIWAQVRIKDPSKNISSELLWQIFNVRTSKSNNDWLLTNKESNRK